MGGAADPADEQAWNKVGAELRRLRVDQGMSLSELARQVHYSTGYLSKIETGKKRITPQLARRADEVLETGGVLTALLPPAERSAPDGTEPEPLSSEDCPYPGLAAFSPPEARWFFGRSQTTTHLISQLDDRLTGGGLLAVVAPSGAGKSSLLAAGLIPALACGALPGSRAWPVVITTPGVHPLATLAAQVAERTGADPAVAAAAIATLDRFAAFLTARVAAYGGKQGKAPGAARMVLIIDQFEEIFTECQQEAQRQAFITALCLAAQRAPVLLVIGVRADFYGRCLAYPALLTALQAPVVLGPMNADQLREIITCPAAAEGCEVELGLIELMLRDLGVTDDPGAEAVGYDPGALPLLAHALRATWQQRNGRVLTVAGYRLTGGIREAIATTAERAYRGLSPAEQQIAQQILLRLVQVGAHTGEFRRRLPRDQLLQALPAPAEAAGKVLETFGRARLLTFDLTSVEITHEALLRAWPRLSGWITADRMGLRVHQLLSEAAEIWEAEGRDPFLLYRGSRLAIAQDWVASRGRMAQLSALEESYLQASDAQRQREQQAERHRRTRRTRKALRLLATLLVVALSAAGISFQKYQTELRKRHLAVAGKLAADSRSLATTQPDAAMLLAVEAFHQENSPETRSALLSAQSQHFTGRLNGHTGNIFSPKFSPDGRILATAGSDGTARLWDVAGHQQIAVLDARAGALYSPTFSHDGRLLATAGIDGTARLWDVAGHQQIAVLDGRAGALYSAAFSHDGRLLATAGKDGTARLWDVASHQLIATLPGGLGPIYGAAFSPDDRILATTSDDGSGTVRLWDVASHQPIDTLAGHIGRVSNVRFSHRGHILATVGRDTTTRLWNVASRQLITTLPGHSYAVNDVAFSPDDRILVTGSGDGTAWLWDVETWQPVGILGDHMNSIIGVAFSQDNRTVATAGEHSTLRLWDTGGSILLSAPPAIGYDAVFSPNSSILATVGEDATARLWNTANRRHIAILAGHIGVVRSAAFSRDGRMLATVGDDGTARLWDTASHQPIATLADHKGGVRGVAFNHDGHILATAGEDSTVRLWDVISHQPIATLAGHDDIVYTVNFSHDGRILATGGQDRTVRLWDVTSRQPIATLSGHTGTINKVVFSPDDQIVATASSDYTARLWDAVRHEPIATLAGHAGVVKSVAFSPDGHTLATASKDTMAKLWNADSHQLIATLTGHTDDVYGVTFSPDGRLLATSGGDRTVRLWDLDTTHVTDRICRIIGTVSPEQWARLIPEIPYRPACH